MNLKATTEEEDDDDKNGPALTMERESTNPSGHEVRVIQSNENSERAVIQEKETDCRVRQASAAL
jgi:hypothetical protein